MPFRKNKELLLQRERAAGRNEKIEDDSEYFSKNLKPGKN
jgi:hypothetical protein